MSNLKNILVTGCNGQLGSEIIRLAQFHNDLNFIFTDITELDITSEIEVLNFFENKDIYAVINAAAYTNVEKAEDEFEKAFKINYLAVANLVKACEINSSKLIHISTDYVFDGCKNTPYRETDETGTIGVYGKSKQKGEYEVIKSNIDSIIIRTSWLYSSYGNNFVKTMIKLSIDKDSLDVVYDQIGTPTYAKDLADTILYIIKNKINISENSRMYHYSNEGVASWYDFAKAIFETKGIKTIVNPILTKDFPSKIERPFFSVLSKEKIKSDFSIKIRHWREALIEMLQNY